MCILWMLYLWDPTITDYCIKTKENQEENMYSQMLWKCQTALNWYIIYFDFGECN